jgi:hypothetical protein
VPFQHDDNGVEHHGQKENNREKQQHWRNGPDKKPTDNQK